MFANFVSIIQKSANNVFIIKLILYIYTVNTFMFAVHKYFNCLCAYLHRVLLIYFNLTVVTLSSQVHQLILRASAYSQIFVN